MSYSSGTVALLFPVPIVLYLTNMYFNQDISIVYPDVEKNVNVSFIEEIKLARFIK